MTGVLVVAWALALVMAEVVGWLVMAEIVKRQDRR